MMLCNIVIRVVLGLALSVIALCPPDAHADPLDNWHWRNPLPQPHDLLGAVHGNGEFVAVGNAGTILSSPDGATWTQRASGTVEALKAVAFGAGMFVAVGDSGTILSSVDGKLWSQRASGVSVSLNAVSIANEGFVVAGNGGTILISSDGVSWAVRTTGTADDLNAIAFGNGVFVAVGHDANHSAFNSYLSNDGVAWTVTNSGLPCIQGIAFGNGTFAAVACLGAILTSSDGLAWTFRAIDASLFITYSDGIFIAGGFATIVTSPDALTWTQITMELPFGSLRHPGNAAGGISGDGTLVVVGGGGVIVTSSDGVSWIPRSSTVTNLNLYYVTYSNGAFLTLADVNLTSPDGLAWTQTSLENPPPGGSVAFGNGVFVAVGYDPSSGGTIFSSTDGITWTLRSSYPAALTGVQFGNGTFVAVGYYPNFFGVQDTGLVVTSSDGITWTQQRDVGLSLLGIAYGSGTFVAVGQNYSGSPSMTSPDGVTWRSTDSNVMQGGSIQLRGIAYGNGTFVAVGYGGAIVTSPDGFDWIRRTSRASNALSGVAFGGDTFVVVGYDGTILQSDNVLRPCEPLIAINNSKGIVSLSATDTLSARINFKARSLTGIDADWWVVASTPFGWFYYVYPDSWTSASDLANIRPAHQGNLFDLSTIQVLQIAGLPMGAYAFYFGIDTNMNGQIDFDRLHLDSVLVNMRP